MNDSNEHVFSRTNGPLLNPGMIFTVLFFGVLLFLRSDNSPSFAYVFIILCLVIIIPALARYRLTTLSVDESSSTVTLVLNKWVGINKEEKFDLSGIKITFKEEIRAKGMKRRIFRFFFEDKLIIEIYPPTSGWQTEELEKAMKIISDLQGKQTEPKQAGKTGL